MEATLGLAAILRDAAKTPLLRMRSVLVDPLTRPEALDKLRDIDQTAGVAPLADPPLAVKSFDLKTDHPALDRDHLCRGPHQCADRRRREMADIDLGADR